MTVAFYILVKQNGEVDLRKTSNFAVPAGHVAARLEIEIADEAFEPMKVPTFTMALPTEALTRPIAIETKLAIEGGSNAS